MANACTGTILSFLTLVLSMHDGFFLPRSSWIPLLSISHRYEFLNVRERAIREIYGPQGNSVPDPEPPDNLTLILTAEKYDVPPQQAFPPFVELVMRKEPLTEVEIERLPALTVHRLARAREDYLRERRYFDHVAMRIVCEIWPAGRE